MHDYSLQRDEWDHFCKYIAQKDQKLQWTNNIPISLDCPWGRRYPDGRMALIRQNYDPCLVAFLHEKFFASPEHKSCLAAAINFTKEYPDFQRTTVKKPAPPMNLDF